MKLVWTKSGLSLSRAIMWITGEDCSHFSIVLYNGKPGEILFESNLLGTHPKFYHTAMQSHTLVHEVDVPLSTEIEDLVWDRIVKQYDGKKYDLKGALYLGFRKLLLRFLNLPLPKSNAWADPSCYFCNELFEILTGVPGIPNVPALNGMATPHDVWEYFRGDINEQ